MISRCRFIGIFFHGDAQNKSIVVLNVGCLAVGRLAVCLGLCRLGRNVVCGAGSIFGLGS
jgi:hypothetical protein